MQVPSVNSFKTRLNPCWLVEDFTAVSDTDFVVNHELLSYLFLFIVHFVYNVVFKMCLCDV